VEFAPDANTPATPSQAGDLILTLHWQALQPIVPPHHIFVHLHAADGTRIAQRDGEPATAEGPAPTGSWLPEEFLTTTHKFTNVMLDTDGYAAVGLYHPADEVRLPVAQADTVIGDAAILPLAP
ncbi:MAG: hypothetical protein WDZ49_04240, partial [Litorilinea sp.]